MTIPAKRPSVGSNDSNDTDDQSNFGMFNLCVARHLPAIASRTYLRQSIKLMPAHAPAGHKRSKSPTMLGKRVKRVR